MQEVVRACINNNENAALLLIDIGVWPFHDLLQKHPNRVKNIGIFEPGTISIAAGLSLAGITPIVYGISPFIVQRALEQLKLDFVYQNTGGNFITTGASYDFSTLGYSHYCMEDVATLYQLPGMEILTPGTPEQFKSLWKSCVFNGHPSYFRMTDYCANYGTDVQFGRASIMKKGKRATVISVAETLDITLEACKDLDVSILYYTTLVPFDSKPLIENNFSRNVFIVEPFYEGTVASILVNELKGEPVRIDGIGIPREVPRNYGTKIEKDAYYGMTSGHIRNLLVNFIGEIK